MKSFDNVFPINVKEALPVVICMYFSLQIFPMRSVLFLATTLLLSSNLFAQKETPESVKSIEAIVKAPLEIISGEKGEIRDWEAFRNLFTATATFSFVQHDTLGNSRYRSFSLEEFVRIGRRGYEGNGFLEYELSKTVDEYNGIAHVFQSYYAKGQKEEKGINSYQLMYDGNRWWITSLIWVSNENGVPLPDGH